MLFLLNVGYADAISVTINQPSAVMDHSFIITVIDYGRTGAGSVSVDVASAPGGTIAGLTVPQEGDPGEFVFRYIDVVGAVGDSNDLVSSVGSLITVTYVGSDDAFYSDTAVVAHSGSPDFGTAIVFNGKPSCISPNHDNDRDGLCSNWETGAGLSIPWVPSGGDATLPPYAYPCDPSCPNPNAKDIYIEIDWMEGHYPDPDSIEAVKAAFIAQGITLHVQVDDMATPHTATIPFPGNSDNPGFDQIKAKKFGTMAERDQNGDGITDPGWTTTNYERKKAAFHYFLFVHDQPGSALGSSGISEIHGNDAMISLGSFAGHVGSTDEQAGTFMHELGHNLRLHHGGGASDQKNCKPNYLSVMNYNRQMSNLISDRDLDYSYKQLNSLSESSPVEGGGTGPYTPEHTDETIVFGPELPWYDMTGQNVNWDRADGDTGTGAASNLNNLNGCNGATAGETFAGYNDWGTINAPGSYNLRFIDNTGNYADGAVTPEIINEDEHCDEPPETNNCVRRPVGVMDPEYKNVQQTYYDSGEEVTKRMVIDQRLSMIDRFDELTDSLPASAFVGGESGRSEVKTLLDQFEILLANDQLSRVLEFINEEWRPLFDGV
ncbi:MAG: hypothetical protein WEC35_06175 [Nitrosopumilaceae archaeon]